MVLDTSGWGSDFSAVGLVDVVANPCPKPLLKRNANAHLLAMLLVVRFINGLPLARFMLHVFADPAAE